MAIQPVGEWRFAFQRHQGRQPRLDRLPGPCQLEPGQARGFIHTGAWYDDENISRAVTSVTDAPRLALDDNANIRVSGSSIANRSQDRGKSFELGGIYPGW